jgi:NADH:ubiquinone oxidoreductase subunit F (NADH-binding)
VNGLALLAGPDIRHGMEPAADHRARLGSLPAGDVAIIDVLERSELRGRGGAGFPVGSKWRSVARNRRGRTAVLVNGAEAEPLSQKDRLLMATRPHLVLDGAALAASTLGADEVVVYIGADHVDALDSMNRAVRQRPVNERDHTRMVVAPARYVAGEETAAVHYVNDGIALPTSIPPRPFERGVGGRPTLVQNVESLAHVAMIARYGDGWFRSLGRDDAVGTTLLTLAGAVTNPGVVEVAQGTTVGEIVESAGGRAASSTAVLVGGYFGGWVAAEEAWELALDTTTLRVQGHALGCGVIAVLPQHRCGVVESARVIAYLAGESARQCGPCVFGLRAIADGMDRIAAGKSGADDLVRVRRWAGQLRGRGGCRHPDGAANFLLSALSVFGEEFLLHHEHRRCSTSRALREVA